MATAMAKKKKGEKADESRERRTAPIQVERDLARMAAVIASHRGVTQSDIVSAHLRPYLRALYQQVQEEIAAELKEPNG